MNRELRRRTAICAFAVCLGAAGRAAGEPLNVKPGLWETTAISVQQGDAVAAMPDLSRLPPEKRAQIEKMLAARSGKPVTHVFRSCVTEEQIRKQTLFSESEAEQKQCQHKILQSTARDQKATLTCEDGKRTGEISIHADGDQRVTGKFTMVRRDQGKEFRVRSEMTASWLGSDCGELKPGQSKKQD
ncbi:MAG TPA: DUF3617 domain-containing protein [Burkholderiales bacterium]|nr:DUF3617 domain-containing protein [Burkholderiales bacterium]